MRTLWINGHQIILFERANDWWALIVDGQRLGVHCSELAAIRVAVSVLQERAVA